MTFDEAVATAYSEGGTLSEIAKAWDTCRKTVREALGRSQTPIRRAGDYTALKVREDGTKWCNRCRQFKPVAAFHYHAQIQCKLKSFCTDCNRRSAFKRAYGITLEDYEKMKAAQQGLCAICGQPESRAHPSGRPYELAVDHCHTTGRIRGLVCSKHNQAIGLFGDNPALLRAAADYLEATS